MTSVTSVSTMSAVTDVTAVTDMAVMAVMATPSHQIVGVVSHSCPCRYLLEVTFVGVGVGVRDW